MTATAPHALSPEDLAAVRAQLARKRIRYRLPSALRGRLAVQRRKEFLQITFMLGPVVYLLFALIAGVGLFQFTEHALEGWNARVFWGSLGLSTVGITLGYFLAFADVVRRHYLWLIVINGSLMIASPLVAALALSEPLMRQEMSYVVMLVVSVVIGVLRAPVVVSALTCGIGLVLGVGVALALGVTPEWIVLAIFYLGATGIGLLVAFMMERIEVIGFLRGVVLEHESAEIARLNAELSRLATEDPLTGLANRRHFDHRLAEAWLQAQRRVDPLALLLVEVDFFAHYNARYGRTAAEECLVAIARALADSLDRPDALAARHDHETFALLIPETDLAGARAAADRAIAAVAALQRAHEGTPAGRVSVSIGVAAQRAITGSPREFVDHADKALYSARAAGRACVREAVV